MTKTQIFPIDIQRFFNFLRKYFVFQQNYFLKMSTILKKVELVSKMAMYYNMYQNKCNQCLIFHILKWSIKLVLNSILEDWEVFDVKQLALTFILRWACFSSTGFQVLCALLNVLISNAHYISLSKQCHSFCYCTHFLHILCYHLSFVKKIEVQFNYNCLVFFHTFIIAC